MRKVLFVIAMLALAALGARADNIPIILVQSAPSGACTNGQPMQLVIPTGVLYSCQAGTWGVVGAGAGGPPTGSAGGDLSGTYPNPAVAGIKSVPFCTGYTPTNGQSVTLTTASSPNPCYTAVANLANPMTTLGDTIYGGASGAATRLAGPTAGAGTYFLIDVPTTTSAVAETFSAAATGTGAPVLANSPVFVNQISSPSIVAPGSASTNSASLGTELTSSGTCSGTGWTGTYPNYVAPGTTAALTCTGFTNGSYYQTVTGVTTNTGGGSLTIAIGGAQTALTGGGASSTTTAGLKANGTSLTYTPQSSFNGTVNISAKLISPISTFSYLGEDSTAAASVQMLLQQTATLHNIYIGGGGTYNTTGNYNAASGNQALFSNTTGYNNIANGYEALYSNTTGNGNAASGIQALFSNTTGNNNTANGYQALYSNTTGNYNAANGYEALFSNTTGNNNAANGYQALFSNTTGSNAANGYEALYSNTTGNGNAASGNQALISNTTGNNNTANGYQALYSNTTGTNNAANGYEALYYNTTGNNNAANGNQALFSNTTGNNNTANGYQAGRYISGGSDSQSDSCEQHISGLQHDGISGQRYR